MASGTPAIGLDVAGARDALADGELGTVVAETELSATIARLLADPNRIRSGWPLRCVRVSAGSCLPTMRGTHGTV